MNQCLFALAAVTSLSFACKGDPSVAPTTDNDRDDVRSNHQSPSPAAENQTPPTKRLTFADKQPVVGDMAPDFEVPRLDGDPVKLSTVTGQRPTVLIFGSYT